MCYLHIFLLILDQLIVMFQYNHILCNNIIFKEIY